MSSWRDSVSERAQAELDTVLDSALRLAQNQLAKAHEFDPFAIIGHDDGRTLEVAIDKTQLGKHPETAEITAALVSQLRMLARQSRCTALTVNTRLNKEKTDAVEIRLEHREGAALVVLLPYKRAKFGSHVEYSPLKAFAGTHEVW